MSNTDLLVQTPRATVTLRILVVDDDEGIHDQFRKLMRVQPPADVEIRSAKTIEETYAAIEASRPDAILLDLYLTSFFAGGSREDEWPAERTLHEIEPMTEKAGCPIIAFSGGDPDVLWPLSVKSYGAYNFFSKTQIFKPSEFITPTFRGQLLKDVTNAIFLHSRLHKGRPLHAA